MSRRNVITTLVTRQNYEVDVVKEDTFKYIVIQTVHWFTQSREQISSLNQGLPSYLHPYENYHKTALKQLVYLAHVYKHNSHTADDYSDVSLVNKDRAATVFRGSSPLNRQGYVEGNPFHSTFF